MFIETRSAEQLGRYLDLATTAARLTAQNMANVDTPGYQAASIDFDAEMRAALSHNGTSAAPQIIHEAGLVSRPDGNNVSMDRESLNLAEAQLKFRTGVSLLRLQNQMVLDAIHADGK
jgi:flagellar basal-body rod protein FlgB